MKYWIIFILFALGLALSAPKTDVGDLKPIQTLVVLSQDDQVIIDGGQGLTGQGATWSEAADNLVETTAGTAFFGTTAHVVMGDMTQLPEILADQRLRPAAKLYVTNSRPSAEDLTPYLASHSGNLTIQQATSNQLAGKPTKIPEIYGEKAGFVLGK